MITYDGSTRCALVLVAIQLTTWQILFCSAHKNLLRHHDQIDTSYEPSLFEPSACKPSTFESFHFFLRYIYLVEQVDLGLLNKRVFSHFGKDKDTRGIWGASGREGRFHVTNFGSWLPSGRNGLVAFRVWGEDGRREFPPARLACAVLINQLTGSVPLVY